MTLLTTIKNVLKNFLFFLINSLILNVISEFMSEINFFQSGIRLYFLTLTLLCATRLLA